MSPGRRHHADNEPARLAHIRVAITSTTQAATIQNPIKLLVPTSPPNHELFVPHYHGVGCIKAPSSCYCGLLYGKCRYYLSNKHSNVDSRLTQKAENRSCLSYCRTSETPIVCRTSRQEPFNQVARYSRLSIATTRYLCFSSQLWVTIFHLQNSVEQDNSLSSLGTPSYIFVVLLLLPLTFSLTTNHARRCECCLWALAAHRPQTVC